MDEAQWGRAALYGGGTARGKLRATELRGYDRSPEATPSTHLWRGALPTTLAPGEHRIDVLAFDRWQGEQLASTVYRLQAAE